jgi:hypothetical protein
VNEYDARGKYTGYTEEVIDCPGAEFHWTVLARSAEEATEIIRKRGYFCGGLDSKFSCSAYAVALLDRDRPAEVPRDEEGSNAVADAVDSSEAPAKAWGVAEGGTTEASISRILTLAKRFKEFVVQT